MRLLRGIIAVFCMPIAAFLLLGADSDGVPQASIYHPPSRPMPGGRVGGASRGIQIGSGIEIEVVAPEDHAGRTTRDQPTLYWTASSAVSVPVEIVVTDDTAIKPLFSRILTPPLAAGLHAVVLTGSGLRFIEGKDYQWTVSAIMKPTARSEDASASGFVERVDQEPPEPATTITLGAAGIWYDAFDTAVRREPQFRASLLSEVGLAPVAGDVSTP